MTVQGDKTAVLQQDCPATTVQQPLHVLQCRSDSMAVLHWRISCGIAVAGAGQEQRSRSSNTPPTVLCACKALTAHRPTCPCTMLAAAALSYLNPAVFTATKNRNSCASVSLLYPSLGAAGREHATGRRGIASAIPSTSERRNRQVRGE